MSEEAKIEENIIPVGKIFTDRKLWLGSMLGGPLMAGYILYKNYKVFNEYNNAKKVLIITILFTIVLFTIIFIMPENINIPNQLIPLIYTGMAWGLLKHLQGDKIEKHINDGGQLIGWGKTLLITILFLIITFVPVLLIFTILS